MTRTTPGCPHPPLLECCTPRIAGPRAVRIQPGFLATAAVQAQHFPAEPRRYALTMGDSLVRTNGQLLQDLGADMLLITYADIVFTETTLRVVRSVGWTLKEARGPRPLPSPLHASFLRLPVTDVSNLQPQDAPSSLRVSVDTHGT